MKILIFFGALLVVTGLMFNQSVGVSGTWVVQAGLVLLLGALIAFTGRKKFFARDLVLLKYIEWGSFAFMIFLIIRGFSSGVWIVHPVGAMIALAGVLWTLREFSSNNPNSEQEKEERFKELTSKNIDQKKELKNYVERWLNEHPIAKWLGVPLIILFALWLFKSILIAFIVGFGVVVFLDKKLIQVKGLNRFVVLLLLYAVGFCFFIVGLHKITDPYNGIFYNMSDIFFNRDSYLFLRDITRGL